MDYMLTNCRVVDFGWVAAGPIAGRLLADMGAEVIKVETHKRLDTSRFTPDNIEKDPEKDPWFHCLNRNKLGITVDITQREGQDLLKRLIAVSDVVIENFYPGLMQRFGLDYSSIRGINPRVIMISLPGLGLWGPESATPSYASSLSALSGLDSVTGYTGERAIGVQQAMSDVNTGITAAFAVLAALWQRRKTGEGQFIELAQLEAFVGCLGEGIMEYSMNHRAKGTMGNSSTDMAPHNNYRCRGTDAWISIAVKTDGEWARLCRAIGRSQLADDERFAGSAARLRHRQELDSLIAEWTSQRTAYEAMDVLQRADVAAVACLDGEARFLDPHFRERGVFDFVPHPATGTTLTPTLPWRAGDTPCPIYRPAPLIGQHNQYVFGELLGMKSEEIMALEARQVLY